MKEQFLVLLFTLLAFVAYECSKGPDENVHLKRGLFAWATWGGVVLLGLWANGVEGFYNNA